MANNPILEHKYPRGIVRIESKDSNDVKQIACGFHIGHGRIVTCYHVFGNELYVFVSPSAEPIPASVILQKGVTNPEALARDLDVIILQLAKTPADLPVMELADEAPNDKIGSTFRVYGFTENSHNGIDGLAELMGVNTEQRGYPALALSSKMITKGFSGSPLIDKTTGKVHGMVCGFYHPDSNNRGDACIGRSIAHIRAAWGFGESPYRALSSFRRDSWNLYFGRSKDAEALLHLIEATNLCEVLGLSGSGKSSLVSAGIERALRYFDSEIREYERIEMIPQGEKDHIDQLSEAVGIKPEAHAEGKKQSIEERLEEFGKALSKKKLLLILDQAERLFSDESDTAASASFLRELARISNHNFKVLLVIRIDYIAHFARIPELQDAIVRHSHFVSAMTETELREAITKPAQERKKVINREVVECLVADVVKRPSALPMLQMTLDALWKASEFTREISMEHLSEIGFMEGGEETKGVSGVMRQKAENSFCEELPNREDQRTGEAILLKTVRLEEPYKGQKAIRSAVQVYFDELDEKQRQTARKLSKTFLLSTGAESSTGKPWYRLAHDSLLWSFARIGTLISKYEPLLLVLSRGIQPHVQTWTREGQPGDYRIPKVALVELKAAKQEAQAKDERMTSLLLSGTPEKLLDQTKKIQRREILKIFVISSFIPIVLLGFLYLQNRIAKSSTAKVEGLLALQKHDYRTAETKFIESISRFGGPEARSLLLEAQSAALKRLGTNSSGSYVCYSDPGDIRAERDEQEKEIRVFFKQDNKWVPKGPLKHYEKVDWMGIRGGDKVRWLVVSFSTDSIYSQSTNYRVKFGKLDNGTASDIKWIDIKEPTHKRIPSVAISPDGKYAVMCSEDRSISLLDLENTESIDSKEYAKVIQTNKEAHGTIVHGVCFSPDGKFFATGGGDYLVKIWELNDWLEKKDLHFQVLEGHTDSVFCMAFDRDGKRIASAGYDRVIRVWNLNGNGDKETDKKANKESVQTRILHGHEGTVLDMRFCKDGLLLTGAKDGYAILWDVDSGVAIESIPAGVGVVRSVASKGYGNPICCGGENGWSEWINGKREVISKAYCGGSTIGGVAWHPGGKKLACAGNDGVIRLYSHEGSLERKFDGEAEGADINGLAWSAKGDLLASVGGKKDLGTIRIWQTKNWIRLDNNRLKQAGPVWGVCFSPDSKSLITSNADSDIRIKMWDLSKWKLLDETEKLGHSVYTLAMSGDGKMLASGNSNAEVSVWKIPNLSKVFKKRKMYDKGEVDIWSVTFTASNDIICGGSDGYVRFWRFQGKEVLIGSKEEQAGRNPTINSVSLLIDQKLIAAGGDGGMVDLYRWNEDPFEIKYDFSLPRQGNIWMVAFYKNSKLAVGGLDGFLRIWDIDSVKVLLKKNQ